MVSLKSAKNGSIPVSVVVPAYNRAALLDAALQSVRDQTVAPEEIVVVDDGSQDDEVGAVARRHGARLLRQDNYGASAARNVGLAAARSPWIAFLDSDDLWLPRKLELQYRVLKQTIGYQAVISNFRVFSSLGLFDETAFELNPVYRSIDKRRVGPDAYELSMVSAGQALVRSMFVQLSGLMIERSVALRVGGFDTTMKRCADHDFALRVCATSRVLSIENAVVRRRIAANALSEGEVEMRVACLELADRVIAHPERYPRGANDLLLQLKPALARKAAASYMKAGDFAGARRVLRPYVHRRAGSRTLAMYCATLMIPEKIAKREARLAFELWERRPWRKGLDWQALTAESAPALNALVEAPE
jgi:glycosyltransferase involved in cell wall biosynthesis